MDNLWRFVAIKETIADHEDRVLDLEASVDLIEEGNRVHAFHALLSGFFIGDLH